MKQKTAPVVHVGWVALIVLLNGRAASSQGFVGDASTRVLSRGLASTTSTTSTTNSCPAEAQACLGDATCAACFQKPQSTLCVSEFLEGDPTCDVVFSGYFCCEYGAEDSCVDNTLLLELVGCNASEAGCTLADSCSNESATESAADVTIDATTDAETEAETEAEAEADDATDAGTSAGRSGAVVLCSTVVAGLLAAVVNSLL